MRNKLIVILQEISLHVREFTVKSFRFLQIETEKGLELTVIQLIKIRYNLLISFQSN